MGPWAQAPPAPQVQVLLRSSSCCVAAGACSTDITDKYISITGNTVFNNSNITVINIIINSNVIIIIINNNTINIIMFSINNGTIII